MSLYPSSRPEEQPSLGELIHSLFQEVSDLIRQHIELGKTELKEDASLWRETAIFFYGGTLLAQTGIIFIAVACMFALAKVLPYWGSALILAAVFLIVAATLFLVGKHTLTSHHEKQPDRNQQHS